MRHYTSDIALNADIGEGTKIWHQAQIREGTKIGKNCIISKNVYVDHDVIIGDNVKVQNNVSIYFKAILEDGVFVGPHVCFTNDKVPRAINLDGSVRNDWTVEKTVVKKGASIGANSTILPGITIGEWALIAAGSIVTKDVPDHGLIIGCPGKLVGYVCYCGKKLVNSLTKGEIVEFTCSCGQKISIKGEKK